MTIDQAEGLRRLFAADVAHMVAVLGDGAQEISAGLALALAGRGRRVLLVDERLGAQQTHPLHDKPVHWDIGAVLKGEQALQEIALTVAGVTLLPAGQMHPVARNESGRIRLLSSLYALARVYDVVLVAAASPVRRGLGFALAAPEMLVLCTGTKAGITSAYGHIKSVATFAGNHHFRLLFRTVDEALARVLFRNLAGVCRQHLGLTPHYAGVIPADAQAAADALEALAAHMSNWPLPERDDGRFDAFMQRLLQSSPGQQKAHA
ncbi:MAG: hypothetical protein N2Z69_04820 [Methylophilaceae bacterium]|nr:hypothetical protein [Methylophilaceae bacterium]